MGGGSYSSDLFKSYTKSRGFSYDDLSDRVTSHRYTSRSLKSSLNPKNRIRECCNSKEHPNTVPVILALDVTGSMGKSCDECAAVLSSLMKKLYNRFEDVELMVMGVGDFGDEHWSGDDAPLQVSQFESDVRIAEQLDDIYMEHGGGGNRWESYTAPWWFGLYRTRLECYDKQNRRGIIITMGDEPLNPILPKERMLDYLGEANGEEPQQYAFDTPTLYEEATKKFDIYHISVDDYSSAYGHRGISYKEEVDESFKKVIGQNYRISTVEKLEDTICNCIEESIKYRDSGKTKFTESKDSNGGIVW